ncbi:MAG: NAD-binding protein, partial [Robiginitalea sp.]|uniref:NAD-binding protein n=1 Tax=Robiginitalea sp. TaxID=1902411 RepID=UPI003C713B96
RYLQRNNRHVVLIDSNESNIDKAQKAGLEAIAANIYADNLTDNIELNDVGYLIAMTANPDINNYAIDKFQDVFGENGSFRIVGTEEINNPDNPDNLKLFSTTDDFVRFLEAVRMNPAIREIPLKDLKHYTELTEKAKNSPGIVTLFLKSPDGELHIIPSFFRESGTITEGYKLVYMGNSLSDSGKQTEKVLTLPGEAN